MYLRGIMLNVMYFTITDQSILTSYIKYGSDGFRYGLDEFYLRWLENSVTHLDWKPSNSFLGFVDKCQT